jgi:hypothetical protein
MSHSTISPALRALYTRQRTLMDQEHLTTAERLELCGIPDQLATEWKKERAIRVLLRDGAPHTIATGPDPRDQAYGDR